MKNERITKAIKKCRNILQKEIVKCLLEVGGSKCIEADCRWIDDDGEIYGSIMTEVRLDEDKDIWLRNDEGEEEHIDLYTIDEIIKIVDAL